jgi:hypothetical protein
LWEERLGTDISILYKINVRKLFEISIGSGIGEGLIWETYYLKYADQAANTTYKKNISLWGQSPYFKQAFFINRDIYKRIGIKVGIDFIYSETTINNANYSSGAFPSLDLYINGMTKCYEHRFVFRIGITYAI